MRYRFQIRGEVVEIAIERQGQGYRAVYNGEAYPLEVLDMQPGQMSLRFAGQPVILYWANDGSGSKWISLNGCTYRLEKPAPRAARQSGEHAGEAVRAPMPAQVRAVLVAEGERVEKGQSLMLLEAMKMEIRVKAPAAGRVVRLLVSAGQAVERDQLLAEIGE